MDSVGQVVHYVAGDDPSACNGKGICNGKTGKCQCSAHFEGQACETETAVSADKGVKAGSELFFCPGFNAFGTLTGTKFCDRTTGIWTCLRGSGRTCEPVTREHEVEVDWSRSMDKWGWSLCPEGSLLTGLKRGKAEGEQNVNRAGDALYSIDSAKCAKPKGNTVENCYHQNWWNTLDSQGGAFCKRNYFVAGLFRSHCNSLYCIEMAKCCQVRRAVWDACKWTQTDAWKRPGYYAEVTGKGSFIAGFYRSTKHTLDGLTQFRECEPKEWGEFGKDF